MTRIRRFLAVALLWSLLLPVLTAALGESAFTGSCGNNPEVSLAAKHLGGNYIGVYEPCCKRHDDCYDRCQGKEACDDDFHSCLTTVCSGREGECANVAELFYTAVAKVPSFSAAAYDAACLAGRQKAGYAPPGSIPFATEPFFLSKGSHKLGDVTITVNAVGQWQINRNEALLSHGTLAKMMEDGLISPEISAAVGNIARRHGVTVGGEDLEIRIADSHVSQNTTVSTLRLGVSSSVGQFELSLSDLHLAQHNSQGLRTFEEHKLLHLHFVAAGPKGEFFAQAFTSAQNIANTFKEHGNGPLSKAEVVSVLDQVIDVSVAGCKTNGKCSKAYNEYRSAVNKAGEFVKTYNTIADVLKDKDSFDGFDKFATSTSLILSNVAQVTNNKDLRKAAVGVGLLAKVGEIGKAVKALASMGKVGFEVALGAVTGGLSAIATGIGAVTELFGGGGGNGIGEALEAIAGMIVDMWQEMRESFNHVFAYLDQINRNVIEMEENNWKRFEFTVELTRKVYVHLNDQIGHFAQRSAGQYTVLQQSIHSGIHLTGIKDVSDILLEMQITSEAAITEDKFCNWVAKLSNWLKNIATEPESNGHLNSIQGKFVLPDADILNALYQSMEYVTNSTAPDSTRRLPLGLFKSLASQFDTQFVAPSKIIDIGDNKWIEVAEVFCNLVQFGTKFIVANDESVQLSYQAFIAGVANVTDDSALFLDRLADSPLLWTGLIGRYQEFFDTIRSESSSASSSVAAPNSFPEHFHWDILMSPSEHFGILEQMKSSLPKLEINRLRHSDDNGNACTNLGELSTTDWQYLKAHRDASVSAVQHDIRAIYANSHQLLTMVKSNCREVAEHKPSPRTKVRDRRLALCFKPDVRSACQHHYFDYNHRAKFRKMVISKHLHNFPDEFTESQSFSLSSNTVVDNHLLKTYLEPAMKIFTKTTKVCTDGYPHRLKLSYVSLAAFILLLDPSANVAQHSSAAIDKLLSVRPSIRDAAFNYDMLKQLNATIAGKAFINSGQTIPRLPWQEEVWSYVGDNRVTLTATELQSRVQKGFANNPFRRQLATAHSRLVALSEFVADSIANNTRGKYDTIISSSLLRERQSSRSLCHVLRAISNEVYNAFTVVSADHGFTFGEGDWFTTCNISVTLSSHLSYVAERGGSTVTGDASSDPCATHGILRFSCFLEQAAGEGTWAYFSAYLSAQVTAENINAFSAMSPLASCIAAGHVQCVRFLLMHDIVVTDADIAAAAAHGDFYISSLAKYYFDLQVLGLETPPIKVGTILSIAANFTASLVGQQVSLENAVLSIGQSGSGKSSLTNARAGVEYIVVPKGLVMIDGEEEFVPNESLLLSPNSIPELVKTARSQSETVIPQIVPMPTHGANLVDLMGIGDSRGIEYDMAMAIMLKKLKHIFSTVRVVELVINHDKIARRDRDSEILPSFELLGRIVGQNPALMDNVLITVNKAYDQWGPEIYLKLIKKLYANNKHTLDDATAYVLENLGTQHIWPIAAPTLDAVAPFWEKHFHNRNSTSFDRLHFDGLTRHTDRLQNMLNAIQRHFKDKQDRLLTELHGTIGTISSVLSDVVPTAVNIPAEFVRHYADQLDALALLRSQNEKLLVFLNGMMATMTKRLQRDFPGIAWNSTDSIGDPSSAPVLCGQLENARVNALVVKEVLGLVATTSAL